MGSRRIQGREERHRANAWPGGEVGEADAAGYLKAGAVGAGPADGLGEGADGRSHRVGELKAEDENLCCFSHITKPFSCTVAR